MTNMMKFLLGWMAALLCIRITLSCAILNNADEYKAVGLYNSARKDAKAFTAICAMITPEEELYVYDVRKTLNEGYSVVYSKWEGQ